MMKYKSEFHVHTRYSKDSLLSFWLILVICKIKNISTIAITDHNELKGAIKYKNKFKKHGIELIVGEEIFTSKGEIIGLNLNKKINDGLTPKQTIKEIKKQGGIVYIPHPYDEKRYKTILVEEEIAKNKKEIDFIEVHNGRNISEEFSKKQNEIAEKYGLRKIIGSDAHTIFELGRNYVFTNEKIMSDTILNNYNDVKFNKKNCIKQAHKITKFARLIKIIIRGDFHELFRIINRKCKKRK